MILKLFLFLDFAREDVYKQLNKKYLKKTPPPPSISIKRDKLIYTILATFKAQMGIQPKVENGLDTKEIVLEIILDPPADLFSFF